MTERLIVDADACIKLGGSEKYHFLYQLIPLLTKKAYIHKYVYDYEILTPASVKTQLNKLVSEGILEIIDESGLSLFERTIFDAVYRNLARVTINANNPNKNRGEVSSLAIAKTLSIPVFFTDERDLQPIIDRVLNSGLDDIICIRIVDVIEKIKRGEIEGFGRKQAKVLWAISEKDTGLFDKKIWPITTK